MGRHRQTIARVLTGLSVIGALIWLLWPSEWSKVEPEPLLAVCTAFVVWLLTEVKQSEEVIEFSATPNDVRVSKELLKLHKNQFRILLNDTDLWMFLDDEIYRKAFHLENSRDRGDLEFQNKRLDTQLEEFMVFLSKFNRHVAQHTTPEDVAGRAHIGYKPIGTVQDDEYQRRLLLSKEANSLADEAWRAYEKLISSIKIETPEALS